MLFQTKMAVPPKPNSQWADVSSFETPSLASGKSPLSVHRRQRSAHRVRGRNACAVKRLGTVLAGEKHLKCNTQVLINKTVTVVKHFLCADGIGISTSHPFSYFHLRTKI